MELQLNSSPNLTMAEITRKLFNSKFLSDIQFHIGGRIIYAHSLELMKRSIVFQHQLATTLGDSKLIPILEMSYACFYQFIRFLYTDNCEFNGEIVFGVFQLAINYKVPKLENMAMEYLSGNSKYMLRYFDMCLQEKWSLPLGRIIETLAHDLPTYLPTKDFLSIKSKSLEQILSFNRINIKESDLFHAVMQWMDHKVDKKEMTLSEGRALLDNYVKLIKFTSMSVDGFLDGLSKNHNWFLEPNFTSILKQTKEGHPTGGHCTSCKCRLDYTYPYDWLSVSSDLIAPTTFTITKELLFIGLRYGNDAPETTHLIQLSGLDVGTNVESSLEFLFSTGRSEQGSRIFSFGNSLQLKPNTKYTLNISYLDRQPNSFLLCRKPNRDVIIRAPADTVRLKKAGLNIIELHFKSVTNDDEVLIVLDN